MSGSAGGNRILREDVQETIEHYRFYVLGVYDTYRNSIITGSYNYSDKKDFGDIDLIVEIHDNFSKKITKENFVKYLETFSDTIIVPFKSEKYKGKKHLNTGEIVTILYPIVHSDKYIQIDNIISKSSEETDFKNHFLSFPAIKQGLILGLVKVAVLENPDLV
jgi:hypothetical protein